jgi:hypothetical protein
LKIMLSFLGFGKSAAEKHETTQPVALGEMGAAPAPNRNKQREMVRLALTAVLRRHGIPSSWLKCELFSIPHAGAVDGTMVQFTVLKWHDGLVLYAPDLQREFLNEIRLFDASVAVGQLMFGWEFSADCGYPNGKLPGKQHWQEDEDDDTGFAPTQMHNDH